MMKERYTSEKYKAIRNVRRSIDKKKKKNAMSTNVTNFNQIGVCFYPFKLKVMKIWRELENMFITFLWSTTKKVSLEIFDTNAKAKLWYK